MISRVPISIDEIISRAKLSLRITNTTEHDDFLEVVISEGARHLDALTLYKKCQETLQIKDSKAKLPNNFQKLLGLRLQKTELVTSFINGQMVQNIPIPVCSPIFYVDKTFLSDCGCNNSDGNNILQNFRDTMQIINGYIIFNSQNIESGTCQLAFFGLNVDENGRLILYSEYERGLSAYACAQWFLAFPNDNRSIAQYDRYMAIWVAQKSWIKGGAWKDEFQKTKMEIASMVNALVSDQTVNWI